jgi:Glu-tRNA(Gln) amidotransferase subunit E-like FAD-binding protein
MYVLYVQEDQMKRIAVNFRLEAELVELLKATAKQKAISKTAMLEECLKAQLSDASSSNGSKKDHVKIVTVASGEVQDLVNAALEQKFNGYFDETEKKIAQLQQDLANLRQSVH